MAQKTPNFSLTALDPGEDVAVDGYAFIRDNIYKIDRLLAATATHDHTDSGTALADPTSAPTLVLTSGTDGDLPAGTTVRYRYVWVDQYGAETKASPEATVATPAAIQAPGAPSGTYTTTGGTLVGGLYNYAVSAYVTTNTNETQLGGRTAVSISYSTTTNSVQLTLPSLPSGATGFNIYRRAPGEAYYSYLESTTGSTYTDDNTPAPTYSRQPQIKNLTNRTNKVNIELPVALPANSTWKIYRTFVSGNWTQSDLKHVTEETFVGSGIIVDNYDDLGLGTGLQTAPEVSQIATVPSKISNNEVDFSYSAHSPSWTGLTTTDATITSRYSQVGKIVHYYGSVVFGAATEVTAALDVSLPVTAANTSGLGTAFYDDDGSGTSYSGTCVISDTSTLDFYSADTGADGVVDAAEPFNWTTGDSFRWSITYEAA